MPKGKNNFFHNSKPHMQLRHGKLKKNSRKHPTVDCSLKPIQHSGVKRSIGKVVPHTNLGQQEY